MSNVIELAQHANYSARKPILLAFFVLLTFLTNELRSFEPTHWILVLIAYGTSEDSGERRSLTRAFTGLIRRINK